jgi:hypothetical protein
MLAVMAKDEHPVIATLKKQMRGQKNRPVIHVLMPDGRVTEFKDKGIVLPECGHGDNGVFAVLIDGNGDVFETPDGTPAVVAIPVVGLDVLADPEKAIVGWHKIAEYLGVAKSTAERMERDGRLPTAKRPTPRKPIYLRKQLDEYLSQKRGM